MIRPLVGALGAAFVAGSLVATTVTAASSAGAAAPAPLPVITSVSPSTALYSSEAAPEPTPTVAITGANFNGATHVFFGKFDAYSFTVVSSTEITAIPSAETLGTTDVTVETPGGTSATSPADQFTLTAPPVPTSPPVVTSVTPATVGGGPNAIVASIQLHGSNFLYATSVQIGGNTIEFASVVSSTVMSVILPPEPIGSVFDLTVTGPGGTSAISPADRITYVTPPPPPPPSGYWEVASDGGVFSFGNATFYGSMGGTRLNAPVVGMATTLSGPNQGYWLVARDGGIFAFGNAKFYGSTGAMHLNSPIVGMAATPDAHGYWLVASDGGVFSFGDAPFLGSLGGTHLNSPIVGMGVLANLSGTQQGYWLAAADGAVYPFGDAPGLGSVDGPLPSPVVGIASNPVRAGYWLVTANGAVLTFGTAPNLGSAANYPLNKPMIGMSTTYDANDNSFAYWEAAADGGIFTFGLAPFYGSTGGLRLNAPIVGVAATPQPLYPPFAP
jgi:IPT/TIG domain